MKKCQVINPGLLAYKDAYQLQKRLLEARAKDLINDTLLLLEHPPVFTIGKNSRANNILVSEKVLKDKAIPIYHVDRGGDITYHGPGQLVGYPILNLGNYGRDVHRYLRNLEEVLVKLLLQYGLPASSRAGYTGVWVADYKVASIGIGIKHWVTFHGFALNVNLDPTPFSMIQACGISGLKVATLTQLLGTVVDIKLLIKNLCHHFGRVFGLRMEIENDREIAWLVD